MRTERRSIEEIDKAWKDFLGGRRMSSDETNEYIRVLKDRIKYLEENRDPCFTEQVIGQKVVKASECPDTGTREITLGNGLHLYIEKR